MKKIAIYLLTLILLTFTIPFFFTKVSTESNAITKEKGESIPENSSEEKPTVTSSTDNNSTTTQEIPIDTTPYNYSNYKTIKLLHTKTNTIEEIPLDEYLYGVVSAEMPVDFELEALKAQATVARTYTVYKIMQNESKHGEADICDDSSCCQAWITKEERFARWDECKQEENWEKIVLAVNETKGKIITYQGAPINAFFHSNSGGATEQPVNVWRGNWLPIPSNGGNCWRRCIFTV